MNDEKPMGQVIQIDEARIRDHLGEMVRGTVEESLSLVASSSNSARPLRFSSISVAPVATVKTTAKITTRGVLYFAMS